MTSIISENIRLRGNLEHGCGCIVDDYCYISADVRLGDYVHIGPGCTLAGGRGHSITVGDYSSISSGCRLYVSSNDYVNDLVVCLPKEADIGDRQYTGHIQLLGFNGLGANTVVMPNVLVDVGAVVGAGSFVPVDRHLKPWTVYAGQPVRKVGMRNKRRVIEEAKKLGKWMEEEDERTS